jgi:hypothetical protein
VKDVRPVLVNGNACLVETVVGVAIESLRFSTSSTFFPAWLAWRSGEHATGETHAHDQAVEHVSRSLIETRASR